MVTCSICIPVSVKNVPPNCGTDGAHGLANGVTPLSITWVHSIPCNTANAVPKAIVASSQLRVQALSPRCAANTPSTIVNELDSRHDVIIVALVMLSTANGVGHAGLEMRL